MNKQREPLPLPKGLDHGPGEEFWNNLTALYDFRIDEKLLLIEVCHLVNTLAAMQERLVNVDMLTIGSVGQEKVNPIYAEMRQQRLALGSMLRQLGIPEPTDGIVSQPSARHKSSSRAAKARWGS